MELPLFPLRTVLFPGMMLPLHIFEPRYREMISRCLEEKLPFGVVLIREGEEAGETARPHVIGTAARITRVDRKPDGRMDIVVVGTKRFRIDELLYNHAYLTGEVSHYPVLNGDTRLAMEQAQRVRPKILEYVELMTKATGVQLQLDELPEEPTTLAFLTAIALQVSATDKQRMLNQAGIPEILDLGNYLLGRELQLLRYMVESQDVVQALTGGPTGYLFAN
ncbi:MAG: LON peptidase substrate-binding domain-containing protein [Caldilineaceae bacterium]|nr:LON peptidase substrate-binding domain-containing protein [Caldilineaceae bacterium]HRJ41711.1 LON peptidase substrate-binding domain-containing protein [Caldilineaceae bacterium]